MPSEPSFEFSDALVTLSRETSGPAEAFRALRTHIMAQHVHGGRRALAICAPSEGVGCTFVAANLAVALSQVGVKTLLIDANMRAPGVDKLFTPSAPTEGLQQCLRSTGSDYGQFIESEVLPDLSIMFSGGVPDDPQELLAGDRFSELMDFFLRDYELTILDTPPANRYADARRVSTVVGYSLIVALRNTTLLSDIRILISQLESERAKVIGTVMTEA